MLNTTNAHPKSVSLAAFVNDGSFICVVVSRRTENVRLLCYVLWCEDTNNLPIHQIFLFISSFLLSIQLISLPLQTTILISVDAGEFCYFPHLSVASVSSCFRSLLLCRAQLLIIFTFYLSCHTLAPLALRQSERPAALKYALISFWRTCSNSFMQYFCKSVTNDSINSKLI